MESQKQQASERIKQANNILVTVSSNPSVDQLAACIGLTLSLNKMGKHATAVFSGEVPSTLEFLQPEKTIERNTDSLRDFIISLDKAKADKLRYKVEDTVVKIFITPYRTSINDKDLEFSQGDFNVDVVLALGVHSQADLDQAIVSHGRILHDATIITMNCKPGGDFGSINWLDVGASSLSELTVQLLDTLDKKLMDGQIATSLLTGIVAETERFSNIKTSPQTMSISAELMAAGANQQLVATKLAEPAPIPRGTAPLAHQETTHGPEAVMPEKAANDGTLEIAHDEKDSVPPIAFAEPSPHIDEQPAPVGIESASGVMPKPVVPAVEETLPEPKPEVEPPQIKIDEHGDLRPVGEDTLPELPKAEPPTISHHREAPKMVLQPPTMGGALSASGAPAQFGANGDTARSDITPDETNPDLPESMKDTPPVAPTILPPTDFPQNAPGTSFLGDQPLLPSEPPKSSEPQSGIELPDTYKNQTLTDIEKDVQSPHLAQLGSAEDSPSAEAQDIDDARSAVESAINAAAPSESLPAIDALNAQPVNLPMGSADVANGAIPVVPPTDPAATATVHPWNPDEPEQPQSASDASSAPPPGPPPMMPQPM